MPKREDTRQLLLAAATTRFRAAGYVATSVDDICAEAKVSKGAFFHHFKSKEDLALAALDNWRAVTAGLDANAPYHALANPTEKLLAALDFYIAFFASQKTLLACLAGITAQEVADTHPPLRNAANACFNAGIARIEPLLAAAAKHEKKNLDTASLATLFVTTLQGALLLARAAQNPALIPQSIRHYKSYIASILQAPSTDTPDPKKKRNTLKNR